MPRSHIYHLGTASSTNHARERAGDEQRGDEPAREAVEGGESHLGLAAVAAVVGRLVDLELDRELVRLWGVAVSLSW